MTPFIDPQNLLTQQELEILQEADACPYEISYAKSLGDIHQQVPVYILDKKDPQEPTTFTVNVSQKELEDFKEWILQSISLLMREINMRRELGMPISRRGLTPRKQDKDLLDKYRKLYDDISGIKPGGIQIPIGDVLGEYIPDKKQPYVNLYIETIRETKNKYCSPVWLLALVYAHEMHHAVYHTDHSIGINTNTFIEEPMAELGMLDWAYHQFVKRNSFGEVYRSAKYWVTAKKDTLPHYGFAAYLCEGKFSFRQDLVVWPEMLVKAIKPLIDSPLIQKYSLPFRLGVYPWPCEAYYERLLQEILLKDQYSHNHGLRQTPSEFNKEAIQEILNMLPQELFERSDVTFCDPFYFSDDFVNAIEERLMIGLTVIIPDKQERLQHIRENQIFRRKDASDISVWSTIPGLFFECPDSSYYQNILGIDSPQAEFTVVMGIPWMGRWFNAIRNAFLITQVKGYGVFCTSAAWYYYYFTNNLSKKEFLLWIREKLSVVIDFEDSRRVISPQYGRMRNGASGIIISNQNNPDFLMKSDDGSLGRRNKYDWDILIREHTANAIIHKFEFNAFRRSSISTPPKIGDCTIVLHDDNLCTDGVLQITQGENLPGQYRITIDSAGVPESVLYAFFESEIGTYIAMTYSGMTKHQTPTHIKSEVRFFLTDIAYVIKGYAQQNGIDFTSHTWDDDDFYKLFGLTEDEIIHVRERLKCN